MQRIPIIIDVDTGTDDAICITAALLHQDQLDIQAFTSVCGNVSLDKTSQNTRNVVSYLGYDLPVAKGAEKPLAHELTTAKSHGNTGLGDVILPVSPHGFLDEPAWEVIYRHALEEKGQLQLLAVGPLTNLALAITRHPDIVPLIRKITIMGGGVWGGNMTMTSEFNIYNDPDAAKIVFDSGIELTMIGLDVTLKPKLPDWVVAETASVNTPYANLVSQIFDFMKRRKTEIGGDDPNLHDVIALASIVRPDLITTKDFFMTVETEGTITRGMTIADFHGVEEKAPNVHAAVDIDIEGFWHWFVDMLKR